MKLGANEPKKVVLLAALVVLVGYSVYSNLLSGPSIPATRTAPLPTAADNTAISLAPADGGPATSPRVAASRGRSDDFHPVLRSKRPEDRPDTSKIDPTLRLDLLTKLQDVALPTGGRNPFKMGQPPPPKAEPLKGPEPIVPLKPKLAEAKAPPPPPGPPQPPPITLKYFGFTSGAGASAKKAFFLDGDDILIAKEGDTLKKRYRVVRISVTSVVMEDMDSKRQQTIPLTEEVG